MEEQSLLPSFRRNGSKRRWCCSSMCCYKRLNAGCVFGKGVILLLVWSAVIHSFGMFIMVQTLSSHEPCFYPVFVILSLVQAIVYLLYPIAGLLCWSRYKLMILGTLVSLLGTCTATPSLSLISMKNGTHCESQYSSFSQLSHIKPIPVVFSCIGIALCQIGLGLFEANAIQFGADQLQSAASEKLSVFVNWYYWSTWFLKIISMTFLFFVIFDRMDIGFSPSPAFFLPSCLLYVICLVLLLVFYFYRRHFDIQPPVARNPVKHVYRVLRFVIQHDQPLFPSAFTYGEVPSRMDYAKERYGGPFTTEQVEDVKTFLRIVLLLLTLFGSLLQPDVNLLDSRLTHKPLFYYAHFQYYLLIVLIPVNLFIIRPCFGRFCYRFTMLHKIRAGLLLSVLYNGLIVLADVLVRSHVYIDLKNLRIITAILSYLSLILYGCSLFLVFLSVLEFILAQAPRGMEGLLIGLWYACQSVSVGFSLLPHSPPVNNYCFFSFKALLSTASLFLFFFASYWYQYRSRNEYSDTNRQSIIEQYTERRLSRAGASSTDTSVGTCISLGSYSSDGMPHRCHDNEQQYV